MSLQNAIVDPRYRESDYRSVQNYVGESVSFGQERVHHVCPRPEQVSSLMAGLIAADGRLREAAIHPVIHAAAIGYGFVFTHPFEDGNGRIHRFLIHNVLAIRGFTPQEIIVPVSAAMLRDPQAYDASLEAFSRPLLEIVDYSLDAEGQMTVRSDRSEWYRFPDLTRQAEALFRFVEQTIERDLPEELAFLKGYDRTKRLMQDVVDLPAGSSTSSFASASRTAARSRPRNASRNFPCSATTRSRVSRRRCGRDSPRPTATRTPENGDLSARSPAPRRCWGFVFYSTSSLSADPSGTGAMCGRLRQSPLFTSVICRPHRAIVM